MAANNYLTKPQAASNPYGGRWRWWYESIADRMIAHPDWTIQQIADDLKKGANTISMIVNTDLFKAHFFERKRRWQEAHDQSLRQKLTAVATNSLDLLVNQMEKKKDLVPIQQMQEIAMSALDRLGFAVKAGPQVVVNNAVQNNTIAPSASADALLQAREAMRKVEQLRASQPASPSPALQELDSMLVESGLIEGEALNVEPDGGTPDAEDADLKIGDGDDAPISSEQ